MLLSMVVLIPKRGNNYCGIGLLEVMWKVLEGVLDGRLKKMELHNAFHCFWQKQGCSTGIMEAKLVQQLAFVEQCSLYGLFLDLRKAYNVMDRVRCLQILEDCGMGPKERQLGFPSLLIQKTAYKFANKLA